MRSVIMRKLCLKSADGYRKYMPGMCFIANCLDGDIRQSRGSFSRRKGFGLSDRFDFTVDRGKLPNLAGVPHSSRFL